METIEESSSSENNISRRSLLRAIGLSAAAAAATAAIAGCGGSTTSGSTPGDDAILNAATTAEAIAAVLYANIVLSSPIYTGLAASPHGAGQSYLVAAYEQEVAHYNLLVASGATAIATTTPIYFPTNTFSSVQAGLDTVDLVEELLVATYLFAINNLSSGSLRQYAAQMMGVESEHRVLSRVAANALGLSSTSGLANNPQMLGTGYAPNNYEYERLFVSQITSLTNIIDYTNYFTVIGAGGFSQVPYTVGTLLPTETVSTTPTFLPQISSNIPAVEQDITVVTIT